jgi:glycosyltransferase involved in cell wall biosynthesis
MSIIKVSIVTISYNQASYLEQAILSVIKQDYPDIEYIIVDPGSTDGTIEIIEKYRPTIAKVIIELDNGPADGLNKGFYLASGEIYGFLNSDDYYLPGAITKIVNYFNKNPFIDVISGNAYVINEHGKILKKIYSDQYSLFGTAYGFSTLIQQATFFRASAYKKTRGFNTSNHTSWDGELYTDLKMGGANFARCNDFLGVFRIHPNSISGSRRLDELYQEDQEKIFQKIYHRKKHWYDVLISYLSRPYRIFTNPKSILEHLKMLVSR